MNACILDCLSLVVQKISESLNRVMMNSLDWLVIASVFSYLPLVLFILGCGFQLRFNKICSKQLYNVSNLKLSMNYDQRLMKSNTETISKLLSEVDDTSAVYRYTIFR